MTKLERAPGHWVRPIGDKGDEAVPVWVPNPLPTSERVEPLTQIPVNFRIERILMNHRNRPSYELIRNNRVIARLPDDLESAYKTALACSELEAAL